MPVTNAPLSAEITFLHSNISLSWQHVYYPRRSIIFIINHRDNCGFCQYTPNRVFRVESGEFTNSRVKHQRQSYFQSGQFCFSKSATHPITGHSFNLLELFFRAFWACLQLASGWTKFVKIKNCPIVLGYQVVCAKLGVLVRFMWDKLIMILVGQNASCVKIINQDQLQLQPHSQIWYFSSSKQ